MSKRGRKRSAPGDRTLPLNAAFQQRLKRGEKPYAACEGLNAAIRARKIRLWCDNTEVRPDWFAGHARVVIKLAPDGRASAEMGMLGRGFEGGPYNWTVSGDGTDDTQSTQRHKPGPKPRDDWPNHVAAWLIRIALDEPDRLDNVDQLTRDASKFLDDKNIQAPQDHKRLRPVIVGFLRYVR